MNRIVLSFLLLTSSVVWLKAQTVSAPVPPTIVTTQAISAPPPMATAAGGYAISIPASRAVAGLTFFSGPSITGAPYSAEMTTTSVQTLADGNQIQHTSNTTTYRDSQGRVRTEQTLSVPFGHNSEAGEAPKWITIQDPVSGNSYILDPVEKIARRSPIPQLKQVAELSKTKVLSTEATMAKPVLGAVVSGSMMPGTVFAANTMPSNDVTSTTSDLGTQVIQGVPAKGTRTTTIFAAGSVGNTLPIEVTSESWYSPDLHTVVMSKNSDPRTGVTTFQLTNINRAEPAASLFQVPADYTIKDDGLPRPVTIRRVEPNGNHE